ncbi:MAG TPA: ATP-dependent zinc metalloprotease FtsH [Candidatus Dormibacteraeota bacterium]|jgi:cell division protease FtsH|nr:ATP-dependent zinc metalloprotease FtsH [Candidatus Dormibacteraeota bacterium]
MRGQRRSLIYILLFAAIAMVALLAYKSFPSQGPTDRTAGQFTQAVVNYRACNGGGTDTGVSCSDKANIISSDPNQQTVLESDGQTVTWYAANGTKYHTTVAPNADVNRLFADNRFFNFKNDTNGGGNFLWSIILPNLVLLVLIAGFMWYMLRQTQSGNNQAMSFGRSRARLLAGDKPAVTFNDVAGVEEAKVELSEIVEFLKFPDKFTAVGARIPKGVLLVGPPGTGKTLLSKAVAGEAGVPFFSISGSEFVEMFVGVGASRVRDLFDQAKKNSPCIVFVDEIDAVGRQRGAGLGGGHDEREQTLNQLLVEMDGFETATHVIVIAATNRPDVLDPALLRPGRFDRHVTLDRPDIRGRKAILEVHARNKPLDPTVELETLARQTPGFSGADLSNLINEAAILTARGNRKVISMKDLEEAIARVIAGPERKSRMISEKEKATIAYHEMGHALVGWTLEHTDPVHKISIVSRGMALGWTMSLPTEDKYLVSKAELVDQLAQILGGRCAEELILGEKNITTGASDDIRKATQLARKMVTEWGMSDKLGPLAFGTKEELVFLGRDLGEQRNYSEEVAGEIDQEVHHLVDSAFLRAKETLRQREPVLRALAERLIEVETMDAAEMGRIIDQAEGRSAATTGDAPAAAAGA